jgi:hypothetical protein
MAGTPYKNLRMFGKLCGEDAIGNVILTTTMWGNLPSKQPGLGEQREKELRDKYWKGMREKGSVVKRFYNTYDSAWEVLDAMDRKPVALLVQEEMVELKKSLRETEAAITLYNNLQKLLVDQQKIIQQLRAEAEEEANTKLVEELMKQEEQVKEQLRKTFKQLRELKIPLGRKLISFLGLGSKTSRSVGTPFYSVILRPSADISYLMLAYAFSRRSNSELEAWCRGLLRTTERSFANFHSTRVERTFLSSIIISRNGTAASIQQGPNISRSAWLHNIGVDGRFCRDPTAAARCRQSTVSL